MKKFFVFISAATMLLGGVSCNKNETPGNEPTGNGVMKIELGFAKDAQSRFTYTASTAVPATTWTDDVKSLWLVLADKTTGTIKVSRSLTVPAATDHAEKSITVNNVATGDYTGYIFANYDQTGISSAFSVTSALNRNINELLLSLTENTSYVLSTEETTAAPATKAYNEVCDLFVARTENIAITTGTNAPASFSLARAISMVRVRINPNFSNTTGANVVSNEVVDFTSPNAEIRLRKTGNGLKYAAYTDAAPAVQGVAATTVAYAKRAWYTATTFPNGYVKQVSGNDGAAAVAADFLDLTTGQTQTAFTDLKILPGGAADGTNRFDIVISGWVEPSDNYIPQGATTPLATAQLVHWNGTVSSAVAANGILVLNIDLETQGKTVVPPVTEVGNIEVKVDLVPWGTISSINMPL